MPLNAHYREWLRGQGHNKNIFVLTERQALMNEGYRHCQERMAAAVKAVDAGMLGEEGVFEKERVAISGS